LFIVFSSEVSLSWLQELLLQRSESLPHPWLADTNDKFYGMDEVIFFGNMSDSIAR
jgi:hypothetical protein